MSKTQRKPYRGSRRFDKTCRCHGSCPYCRGNRTHNDRKRRKAAEQAIAYYINGDEL